MPQRIGNPENVGEIEIEGETIMAWLGFGRRGPSILAACAALALAGIGSARASVISSTPTLPLLGVPYVSSTGAGCFAAAGVCVSPGTFTLTAPVSSTFGPTGQDIVTGATYAGILTNLSLVPIGLVNLSGTVEQEVEGRTFATETGSWTTDLIALSLSGLVLGHTLTLTLDPAHPGESTGLTSITDISIGQDKRFRIDSFYD